MADPGRFYVKDFGAVGDGITDDTAAIQAAINAASDEIERRAENARLRALGVDPGRVIDGETVQPARKEIEG